MIRKTIKDHARIVFNGNGYDDAWIDEAVNVRGLENLKTTPDCMPRLLDEKNVAMLTSHGVFTVAELESRTEIMLENYCNSIEIEAATMTDMARTEIVPAVEAFAREIAETAAAEAGRGAEREPEQRDRPGRALVGAGRAHARRGGRPRRGGRASRGDLGRRRALRGDSRRGARRHGRPARPADEAETITSKRFWPFPTYGDLLFGVR